MKAVHAVYELLVLALDSEATSNSEAKGFLKKGEIGIFHSHHWILG